MGIITAGSFTQSTSSSHLFTWEVVPDRICLTGQVGRTGRAGNVGRVTSLYTPNHAVLAEAIKAAVDAGEPVEGAFSRNRSFSKKVRKYGKYVPRGQNMQRA